MIESLISPEGGVLTGLALNAYNAWREEKQYQRERVESAEATSKEQGQAGIAYGDSETFHWIKRGVALAVIVNFFAMQWTLAFKPWVVQNLMTRFNKVLFFGGRDSIGLAFTEASLYFAYTVVSYYLVSVVRHK